MRDLYNIDYKYQAAIEKAKKQLEKGTYQSIMRYHDFCISKDIKKHRLIKIVNLLKLVSIMSGKILTKLSKQELIQILAKINQTGLSKSTRRDYIIVLNGYLKFALAKRRYNSIDELFKHKPSSQVRAPIRRIQESDMPSILNATNSAEMKLLLSLLWETGARIGEVLNLQKEDIEDGQNLYLNLDGKTGKRKIVVVENADSLRKLAYVSAGGYLFSSDHRKFTIELKRIQKITGLPELYAHLFRKSRASTLLQNVPEQIVKKYLGWTPDSKMLKHYSFISHEEANSAILKMHQKINPYAPQLSLQKHYKTVNLRNYDRKFQKIGRFSA